jgi:phosphate transport system permease protein
MTDAALPKSTVDIHTTDAAKSRLKARYRAETRFRLMGLTAVGLAAGFLVLFLSTILSQGIPAFFQHYATLQMDLKRDEIDPQGTNDPRVIGQANFDAVVRNALYAALPEVTERQDRRSLQGIVSSGAPVITREQVIANPSWIGTTRAVRVPMDDVADMYLKGRMTDVVVRPSNGQLAVSATRGTVQLSSTSNTFQPILAEIKRELARLASRTRADLAGKDRVVARLEATLTGLNAQMATLSGADRERMQARITSENQALEASRREIDTLRARLTDLEQRASAADQRERLDNTLPSFLIRVNDGVIKLTGVASAVAEGQVLLPLKADTPAAAGAWTIVEHTTPESNRRITDRDIVYIDALQARGAIHQSVSTEFFTNGASREPELAGVWVAIVGSLLTLLVTLAISFPVGVAAAIYLEEFAPKNRLTEIIEVNINNLAAVPSIIFGLLGLAVFLNAFDMPRSAPVVGGLVLALMTLPIIIIASRAAIRAVPPSIKEAALGVGASHQQAVFHHVLPLAMPGILTGTILGMAHALGETAPLLMIGMVAFVVDLPGGMTDAATLLPVQIFMWADFPELAFQEKTAAAIIILLLFLIFMNGLAVLLRKKFERRW